MNVDKSQCHDDYDVKHVDTVSLVALLAFFFCSKQTLEKKKCFKLKVRGKTQEYK